MSQENCACSKDIMIFACSGASNLGQLANQAAVELTQEGFGKMFCLAQIGANIGKYVQSAKVMDEIVVIDGCEKACGKTVLENALMHMKKHIVISRLGIKEKNNFFNNPDDLAALKHKVKLAFPYPIKVTFPSSTPLSPGDRAKSRQLGGKCC
ncbi:putative zinc-binding protein [Desulfobacula toluolica]|uniref:Conserved uncharacterized protein, DGC domain n=1 Tax=Desulfobacula toluolica (strain DSM 7467 / Tol2) TaxID=651182 RepID=K0NPP4_DESTT|nr:putative zinc-binding protein [Desulfobacula toluolica]CCK82103.1 conserved uncharacterized protein, DGC domain [Desulfobacula toluolica Tol2]